MEPVVVTFTPTAEDYLGAQRALSGGKGRLYTVVVFLIFIGLAVAIFSQLDMDRQRLFNMLLTLLPLVIIVIVIWALLRGQSGQIRARVSQHEQLRVETTWRVDDENIQFSSQYQDTRVTWQTFSRAIETKEYFLLTYAVRDQMYQFIPRRAFTSPEHEAQFRDMLQRHLAYVLKA